MKSGLAEQILDTWRVHNEILLYLLDKVPTKGWAALPAGSKGRDVARQFDHLYRVRAVWLSFHLRAKRPKWPRQDKMPRLTKAAVRKTLVKTGEQVAAFLEKACRGEAAPQMFRKNAVRWMGYLIAHESHHRGSILLALRQNGVRLSNEIAIQGLWGKWFWGKN